MWNVTLRSVERGWSAAGLLQPLWERYERGRDELAERVGTSGTVLSSINSGKRRLGLNLAKRLAAELRISLLELGAPAAVAQADGQSSALLRHLAQLAANDAEMLENQAAALELLEEIRAALEPPSSAGRTVPKRRPR